MRPLVAALSLLLAAAVHGAPASPQPLLGNLAGEIVLTGAPVLKWTVSLHSETAGQPGAVLLVTGEGLTLRATVGVTPLGLPATWQVDQAELDLSPWAAALPRFVPALAGATATGMVRLRGSGTFENGLPVGSLSVECNNATFEHAQQGWKLAGIGLRGNFSVNGQTLTSSSPLEFSIGTITTARLGARNFLVRGNLSFPGTFTATSTFIEIAGGEMVAEPFEVSLAAPAFNTLVHFRRIGLQDFVALMQSGLSDARGRIHGDVNLGWSATRGFELGQGTIHLDEFEPTLLRLFPAKGFLTSRVPMRINLLPGRLGRWFSFVNPSYEDLRQIEMGEIELDVKDLVVNLSPNGDPQGHTATAVVQARPAKARSTVGGVTFTINLSGPLASIMKISMTESFSASVR